MSHAYDDEWREEARRHQMLEVGFDQASRRCLVATGVGPGWTCLEVESVDFCSCVPLAGEGTDLFARSIRVGLEFMAGLGFDPYYGRRIGEAMRQLGLQDVQLEGKCHEIGGQRPLTDAWPLALHRFRETFVREGWFSEKEIDALPRLMRQPDFCAIGPTLFSVRGRYV